MRILVANGNDRERTQVSAFLRAAGHTPFNVASEQEAARVAQKEQPDVAIVIAEPGAPPPCELIRAVGCDRTPSPGILVVTSDPTEEWLSQTYQSGADGHLVRPYGRAYLSVRLEAVARRMGLAAAQSKPTGEKAAASTALDLVRASTTWRGIHQRLSGAASQFLTLDVQLAPSAPPSVRPALASSIMLSSVKHELELCIAISIDRLSAGALAAHLFGPDADGLEEDMLGELANILMGAVKTSFSSEEIPFTGGLPQSISADEPLLTGARYHLQETLTLRMADAWLVIQLGLRSKGNFMLPSGSLQEGMVLAKDVFNAKGLLLINGGTRLSLNMIERLQRLLSPKHPVEVMEA